MAEPEDFIDTSLTAEPGKAVFDLRSTRIRTLVITDKGRRALWWDRLGIPIPPNYHAWGAADSSRCPNGHPVRASRQCSACALAGSFERLQK